MQKLPANALVGIQALLAYFRLYDQYRSRLRPNRRSTNVMVASTILVLPALRAHEGRPCLVKDIVAECAPFVSEATVLREIQELVDDGLIVVDTDPRDRRRRIVRLPAYMREEVNKFFRDLEKIVRRLIGVI